MHSNEERKKRVLIMTAIMIVLLIAVACEEHLIQRATSDYFQYESGNWWRLVGAVDTLIVEIEPLDTIRQQEVIPVSYNGVGHFVYEADDALYEYVSITYTFSGSDHEVIDDFITKIELPFVVGTSWHDSLYNTIDVSGQQIAARHDLTGRVTDCQYNSLYDGDVYTIEISTSTLIQTPDTTINDSLSILEEYAPGIGIIRFLNDIDDYMVIDYQVQ
jgi:hypothetical protein